MAKLQQTDLYSGLHSVVLPYEVCIPEGEINAVLVHISCASIQQCRAEQTSRVSLCRYRVVSYIIECKSGN